jgi:glycosyltransferase involved in cell wall biosynthesis
MAEEVCRGGSETHKNPRICIVHRYPIKDAIGTNPSLLLVVQELVKSGWFVTYLSYRSSLDNDHHIPGLRVLSLPLTYDRRRRFDMRVKSLIFVILSPVFLLMRRTDFDVVYCEDALPVYQYLIKKATGLKVIYRMGDHMIGYFLADTSNPLVRLLAAVATYPEACMLRALDRVLPISKSMCDYLVSRGIPAGATSIASECVDTDLFKPGIDREGKRRELGVLDSEILVMFHGSLASWKGTEILIPSVSQLMSDKSNVKLMIVGDGPALYHLERLSVDFRIRSRAIFTGWVRYDLLPRYIAACDIGIVLRNAAFGNNFVLTTALLQYLACDRPVIAPRLLEIQTLLPDPLLFTPGDGIDLASKLRSIVDGVHENRTFFQELGRRIRSRYSKEAVARDLLKEIRQTAGVPR